MPARRRCRATALGCGGERASGSSVLRLLCRTLQLPAPLPGAAGTCWRGRGAATPASCAERSAACACACSALGLCSAAAIECCGPALAPPCPCVQAQPQEGPQHTRGASLLPAGGRAVRCAPALCRGRLRGTARSPQSCSTVRVGKGPEQRPGAAPAVSRDRSPHARQTVPGDSPWQRQGLCVLGERSGEKRLQRQRQQHPGLPLRAGKPRAGSAASGPTARALSGPAEASLVRLCPAEGRRRQ